MVNLFECIRTDPQRLARMIYMTPYSREIYERAYREVSDNKFQAALSFIIRLNMGHGFRTNGRKVGWKIDVQGRERSYASQDWCALPDKIMLAAERLRGVQIENRPTVELIQRFNFENVLIYCDPPYMLETRHGKQYRCEMNDLDHEELLKVLLRHKGYVLISGYPSEMYEDMLSGWYRYEATAYPQVASKKKEVLWTNFSPVNQQMYLTV